MEKKNYNIEIFFESQKKSFVILSKNKITLEEVKSRTIKEFNIPSEYEKDMRFSVMINNRLITLLNDYQIMKNFEEISKGNFYLKINFNINNNNYIYQSPSSSSIMKLKNKNKKQNIEKKEEFSIISKMPNNSGDNKYIEEIIKLKDEIEKLKNENTNKTEFDIRKFDEKYRDLSNKNNDLEQKISLLENENKALKMKQSKNFFDDDNTDVINHNNDNDNYNDNTLIKKIEKIFTKLINEHDNNIRKEISDMKNKMDAILNKQKDLFNYKKVNKMQNDNNFELLNDNNDNNEIVKNITEQKGEEKDNNINNNIVDILEESNENNMINKINKDKVNSFINFKNDNNNSDDLKNLENISENRTENNITIKNITDFNIENKKEDNTYLNPKVKRNINFYEEEEENQKSSKSFDISDKTKKKLEPKEQNTFKDIKNNFLENNKNIEKYFLDKTGKNNMQKYTKYVMPNNLKIPEKIKIKPKRQSLIYNNSNPNNNFNISNRKQQNLSDEDLINYESCSEFNTEIRHIKNKNKNDHNPLLKKEKIRNINKVNNYHINDKMHTPTPSSEYTITDKKKKNYNNQNKYYESFTTPNVKGFKIKEDIETYFINVFQSIFFYGNNGYVNMLNISDKLIKKLKEGLVLYRNNINEVKDSTLKYISYSIVPIINDINTKEYQRKILKEKIKKVLEYMKIDTNYFEKEYKIIKNEKNKSEKNSEERNIKGINITHSKINEFRKDYELKEKDYPDELLIKALIRYRGNKEMAFQYLFY